MDGVASDRTIAIFSDFGTGTQKQTDETGQCKRTREQIRRDSIRSLFNRRDSRTGCNGQKDTAAGEESERRECFVTD